MKKIGVALCGSFCTLDKIIEVLKDLKSKDYDITPIFSETMKSTDTKFGLCSEITQKIIDICGNKPIDSITKAEPIGPTKMFDALVIAPCTGNTLSKLTNAITDNTVTMAAKSHLRNGRPVIISLATNDGLSGSAKNLGELLNRKNYYFVPLGQDDSKNKPCSLVADVTLIEDTIKFALNGKQIEPLLITY